MQRILPIGTCEANPSGVCDRHCPTNVIIVITDARTNVGISQLLVRQGTPTKRKWHIPSDASVAFLPAIHIYGVISVLDCIPAVDITVSWLFQLLRLCPSPVQ